MNVPLPGTVSTVPVLTRSETAWRTVAGPTPSSAISARTEGNLSPAVPLLTNPSRWVLTRAGALSLDMSSESSATAPPQEAFGLVLGSIGVLIFSFTLPATRVAVPVFGGWTVGIGRAVGAGLLAAAVLAVKRTPIPDLATFRRLAVVAGGVVVGFPLFTALALVSVPASRGAIVVGMLPAATALVATLRHGERPSRSFWLAATGGLITVVVFAIVTGTRGRPEPADALLLLAVASAAIGYAEGGSVSRSIGGWQTISWALVLALPITLPVAIIAMVSHGIIEADAASVAGFAYVTIFSMLVGFFAWYAGLSKGGVARVSQIQLTQPILTLLWASLLLNEEITPTAMLAAVLVLVFVLMTRRAPVTTSKPADPAIAGGQ